jgi:N-acetylglucosaminyldiphosphoundecaprenol N-acetyl-beta-D-mannosaminyltransferase
MPDLLGYRIYNKNLEDIDYASKKVINTINPHSYCMAEDDPIFKDALINSDVLLPDGIGIVWAERVLNKKNIKKIAGYDLFVFLMERANRKQQSVFFLGASEETLSKIKAKANIEYPKVKVYSFSPPFKQRFSEKESAVMCTKVNTVQPDVLFVGMTAPKQEKWVYLHKDILDAKNICSVGAVFDYYAGNIKRSSAFWIDLGLEWLPRFFREPRRLFKRNFVSMPKFIVIVIFNYLKSNLF